MASEKSYRPLFLNIVSAVIGSLIALVGVWISIGSNENIAQIQNMTQNTSILFNRIEILESRTSEMSQKIAAYELTISKLQVENVALKSKIITQFNQANELYSFFQYMPGPAWMKNTEGSMIWINKAYEKYYGVSKLEYEGATDFDIWPRESALRFRHNDMLVYETKRSIVVSETIDGKEWIIWKFPVVLEGEIIGIGGVAIPPTDLPD